MDSFKGVGFGQRLFFMYGGQGYALDQDARVKSKNTDENKKDVPGYHEPLHAQIPPPRGMYIYHNIHLKG